MLILAITHMARITLFLSLLQTIRLETCPFWAICQLSKYTNIWQIWYVACAVGSLLEAIKFLSLQFTPSSGLRRRRCKDQEHRFNFFCNADWGTKDLLTNTLSTIWLLATPISRKIVIDFFIALSNLTINLKFLFFAWEPPEGWPYLSDYISTSNCVHWCCSKGLKSLLNHSFVFEPVTLCKLRLQIYTLVCFFILRPLGFPFWFGEEIIQIFSVGSRILSGYQISLPFLVCSVYVAGRHLSPSTFPLSLLQVQRKSCLFGSLTSF